MRDTLLERAVRKGNPRRQLGRIGSQYVARTRGREREKGMRRALSILCMLLVGLLLVACATNGGLGGNAVDAPSRKSLSLTPFSIFEGFGGSAMKSIFEGFGGSDVISDDASDARDGSEGSSGNSADGITGTDGTDENGNPDEKAAESIAEDSGGSVKRADCTKSVFEVVGKIDDSMCLLAGVGLGGGGLYFLDTAALPAGEAPKEIWEGGTKLEVVYSCISDVNPFMIGDPQSATALGQSNDVVGFFLARILEIYKEDSGLNEGISTVVLDLSHLSGFTTDEKEALTYLTEYHLGVSTRQGTYAGLIEEGLLSEDTLNFPDGVLITLTGNVSDDGAVCFSVSKWRSGTGAIGRTDSSGTIDGDSFTYTPGGMFIS